MRRVVEMVREEARAEGAVPAREVRAMLVAEGAGSVVPVDGSGSSSDGEEEGEEVVVAVGKVAVEEVAMEVAVEVAGEGSGGTDGSD